FRRSFTIGTQRTFIRVPQYFPKSTPVLSQEYWHETLLIIVGVTTSKSSASKNIFKTIGFGAQNRLFGGAKQAILKRKTIGLRFDIKLKKATPHLEPP
ncbi:hypothetical protein, partial [Prevotella disiens]|uniref:hypothetical protein n=1 Tax=Prevotella disiens TaxID=28130 RepID=UPI00056861C4